MNEFQIVIDPYQEINYALLNGSPLPELNEFTNFKKVKMLDWAYKLGNIAENLINDYYSLIIVGEDFDALFISKLMESNQLCQKCVHKHFLFNSPVEKRYNSLKRLSQQYSCKVKPEDFTLKVYSACDLNIQNDLITPCDMHEAFILIVEDDSFDLSQIRDGKSHIILKTDGRNTITHIDQKNYLWSLPQNELDSVVSMLVDRFSKIRFIIAASEELNNNKALSNNDKQFLELALSVEPLVKIERIEKIEIGKSAKINVSLLPEGFPLPDLTVVSKDENVIMTDGLNLKAMNVGSAVIEIYKSNEKKAIFKQNVDTYQDKTVNQIDLDRAEPNMGIGRTQKINISFKPDDATDADYIVWTVDDPSVLKIDNDGNVTAISPGRALVTASTKNAKDSVIIDVLPNITQMNLSFNKIKAMKGETKPIQIQYSPEKVFDPSYSWISNNPNIAHVETDINGASFIIAAELGECDITCVANEGGCNASCHVTVLDPSAEEKKKKNMIDIACIIGIPAILILLFLLFDLFGH